MKTFKSFVKDLGTFKVKPKVERKSDKLGKHTNNWQPSKSKSKSEEPSYPTALL